jgi:toxin HigB-1
MIVGFAHKGLEKFYKTGSMAGIQAKYAEKLRHILDHLNIARVISDLDLPGAKLHPLKGDLKGLWSMKVSANWRIIFRFHDGDADVVDYVDYH